MFRANNFDKLLDKATSNLRLEPDWPTILQICDLIRQNDCTPKYAVAGVKKKLYSTNPHQAMFALLTLESIVKNCGSGVHDEVTSKAFCEMLRDLVKTTQHDNLKTKILELIQAWAFAFRNSPKYRAVQDTVNILKAEGFKFPALKESDAMFSADTAPEWADGEVCHRCRVAFSIIVRRHHCRACGQVFCQQCSSKTSTLPKFGIEKEVRVCDACFDKVSRPPSSSAKLDIVDTANDYGPTQAQKRPSTAPGGKTAEELQEEEELQLALALSQSEAEHKEKERKSRPHIAPDPTPHPTVSPTPSSVSASPEHSVQASSELSRYLDRNYWESRLARDNGPTAPAPASQASNDTAELQDFAKAPVNKAQDDDAQDKEIDEFVETLKSQVEIFVNRMKSNSSRGRSIANDTAVQTLFMNITAMHSRLLKYIQQLDDKRVYLESLQDKVTQIRDSRAALDTLRAEHAARTLQAAEAAERQRQMQMASKLQAMRKKKHEYLQYQRQLALQRVQEQEREMQLRQEQQKHQYMMSANSYYMPGVSMQQFQPQYPNQPIYANPQFHQMMPQSTDANLPAPQPQMTQANMPNQMGTIAQSMPQLPNYAMSQSNAIQPPATQSMAQNIRPNPQMQMTPMMMQQMHQMRMPVQPGMHQMLPQNPQGQSLPQQNGTLPKNLPNQPPNSMMTQMAMGQQNIPQQMMNPNPMMGLHMQNMRMPMMQGNNPQLQGYMSLPNNTQAPSMQQSQMMPGQMLQGPVGQMQGIPQMPGHNIPTSVPSSQQVPHTQGQQMVQQPGQMPQQPQQMTQPQSISQQPQMSQQPQQMNQQPQMSQQPQQIQINQQPQLNPQPQMNQQPQQMPPQQNQMTPSQPMPGQQPGHMMMQQPQGNMQMPQGPIMNQGPGNPGQQMMQGPMTSQIQGQMQQHTAQGPGQGQAMKMPPNNLVQGQPGQPMVNQQTQQPQTPVKSEHNNNTAELISFD